MIFCSNCGNRLAEGLKYCNSCGFRLGVEDDNDKEGKPGKMLDGILTTVFLIVLFGLGILVGLVAVMLDKNVMPQLVAIVVIAYLGAIFGISFTLLSQVPKLVDAKLSERKQGRLPAATHQQLEPANTAEFIDHPIASVTDHTTRTLEEVPVRRK
ncbi:MAG: zinc ribbon domain-containing protein [Acidobacteriota bacterium]|nr:MAG: zinc ribbon domain-containing protein [Acidobacteriota bacterium]